MRLSPWTLSLLVALHAGGAAAEDLIPRTPEAQDRPPTVTLRALDLRHLAVREEAPEIAPTRRWFDHVDTGKHGFKYQNSLVLDGRRLRYSVHGPVQKDRRFGLTFELRF